MNTLPLEKFDVFPWLKEYFPSDDIVREDMPNVLDFCLIWNLFESKVCEKLQDYSPKRFVEKMECFIKKLLCMNSLVNENFNSTLCYFKKRYLTDGDVNGKFHELNIKNPEREQLVKLVLKGENDEPSSVLLALLIIIYRLRNKLFHGEKPIHELHEQDINFNVANSCLAKVLDLHKTLER